MKGNALMCPFISIFHPETGVIKQLWLTFETKVAMRCVDLWDIFNDLYHCCGGWLDLRIRYLVVKLVVRN